MPAIPTLRWGYATFLPIWASGRAARTSWNLPSPCARWTLQNNCCHARPRIIGLGVYIWNITETTALVELLKALAPDVVIVLGWPRSQLRNRATTITQLADYVITGAGGCQFPSPVWAVIEGAKAVAQGDSGGTSPIATTWPCLTQQYTDDDLATPFHLRGSVAGLPLQV